MERFVFACGAFALLAACNILSGSDELSAGPTIDLPNRSAGEAHDDAGANPKATGHDRGKPGGDAGAKEQPPNQIDAGFDAATPIAGPDFSDLFTRSDDPNIGNGWSEKEDKFSLTGNTILQSGLGSGTYINGIVRRPASEPALDVQLSVDFTYGDEQNIVSDPTLYARMQPDSDQMRRLTGYTFYAYRDFAGLDREDGNDGLELASQTISPELAKGEKYHYVFRITGTAPVKLEASIAKADGTVIVQMVTLDNSPKKITQPGQVGFGSGKADQGKWTNFARYDLP